ncbi:MAG: homoserine dehydrogenase [Nitrososphaerota archaeon]|nr:homoserine dehydrogenase [Nitrososphaerota archaeon]MDG6955084.1 homoserine dehydrogenase [Nitrososphaerota archaeon]MDG6958235.1 homoserine dehydrogenase [Nitrososphaerota archaeon]MDG6962706.1 homoserine dehydrogenase [Nitrososphaerota archaeon]MDG6967873.1 homoserine dehydrogenase [Nitrososphaerota archaeon]
MSREIRVIIVGLGTVGTALARRIRSERYGDDIRVVAAVDSKSAAVDDGGLDLRKVLLRKRRTGMVGDDTEHPEPLAVIRETDAHVLVELTPSNPVNAEPALSHISAALASGKDVVTANKMSLALCYRQLLADAKRRGRALRYGACVGGGLPVTDLGELIALADEVTAIDGVLNTTSNFILSEMEERRVEFESTLSEAKRLGYAEADPGLDIDGVDSACKIVILANHVLGKSFTLESVRPLEGIRGIAQARMEKARRKGRRLRMVASAADGVSVRVEELPEADSLCVRGTDNAVRFDCRLSGPRVIEGPAGGGAATSTAVLRDLLAIRKLRFGG